MRLRITFSKTGALRYAGHLDLQKIWERTVRRAGLLLTYSQGFHPSPKIHLASALPLGFVGRAEIVDIWLDGTAETLSHPFKDLLQPVAPPGLAMLNFEEVDPQVPALQTQVLSADYEVTLLESMDEEVLGQRLAAVLSAVFLPRERRGKPYDLRPLIESLELLTGGGSDAPRIAMRLAAREGATGRPEEVLDVLGIPFEKTRIERIRLILGDTIS